MEWTQGQLHKQQSEPSMSALGQKRTSGHDQIMSALPPKADIRWLLDQLISAAGEWQRNGEAERFGGLKVDDQLDLGDLVNG